MTTEIVPSSQGPVVVHEGMVLHLSDFEGLCMAIDAHPELLQNLEDSIVEFVTTITEYNLEMFTTKRVPNSKIMTESVRCMDEFHNLAYVVYKGHMEQKVIQSNPSLPRDAVPAEVIRTNHPVINAFYRFSLE
jgi:hypothetical protein